MALTARPTVEDVVAVATEQLVGAGPAEHPVIAPLAVVGVETFTTVDGVLPGTSEDRVDVDPSVEVVVAGPAIEFIDAGLAVDPVVASRSDVHVGVVAAVDFVIAHAPVQKVGEGTTVNDVVTGLSVDMVGPGVAEQNVIACVAVAGVVAVAEIEEVGIHGAAHDLVRVEAASGGAIGVEAVVRSCIEDVVDARLIDHRPVENLRVAEVGVNADLLRLDEIAVLVITLDAASDRIGVFPDLDVAVGHEHDIAVEVLGPGVPLDHVLELLGRRRG